MIDMFYGYGGQCKKDQEMEQVARLQHEEERGEAERKAREALATCSEERKVA